MAPEESQSDPLGLYGIQLSHFECCVPSTLYLQIDRSAAQARWT